MISRKVSVVDSHTEGNPTRVIVSGVPTPPGTSLEERYAWLEEHDDALRRLLNFEPRGGPGTCSVLLLPPQIPHADFAVVIMEQDEYVPMCGHCIIGAATTVVQEHLIARTETPVEVRFETLAGLVTCRVTWDGVDAGPVTIRNVEAFVLACDVELEVANIGKITLDVAFGGDFYAIVDADQLGLVLGVENEPVAGRYARAITEALRSAMDVRHPENGAVAGCNEVLFTRKSYTRAVYNQAIVSPPGVYDRSPCGTGTSARLAALTARGILDVGQTAEFEGVLGTRFTGSVVDVVERGGRVFVTPEITGRAYITGYATIVLDDSDPLPAGFRIGYPLRHGSAVPIHRRHGAGAAEQVRVGVG